MCSSDLSHRNAKEHVRVVEDILKEMRLVDIPRILVLNKVDLLPDDADPVEIAEEISSGYPGPYVLMSATTGLGGLGLLNTVDETLADIANRVQASTV